MTNTRIAAGLGILLLIGGIVFFTRFLTPGPNCRDCNVILITVDSITASHLKTYGYTRATTPNLDAWAKNALVFDQYITTSDLTPITQTSIQTGLYPSHSGVVSFSSPLPTTVPILAEVLKQSGYKTAAYGSAPEYYEAGVSGWQTRRNNFKRGFDEFFDEYFEQQMMPATSSAATNVYQWPAQERGLPWGVIDWVKQRKADKFFLWIPLGTVHWPYNDSKPYHFADTSYQGLFKNDTMNWRLPSQFKRVYNNTFFPKDGAPVPLLPSDLQFVIDRYDDGLFLTDQFLGQLFKTLDEKNLTKNSVIIFTTEHGEEFGEHKYIAHYDVYDPEINTPLLIKIPGVVPKRFTAQVSTIDILPTLLDTIGIRWPGILDGKSFYPYIAQNKTIPDTFRPYAFIERTPLMETLMFDTRSNDEQWLYEFLDKNRNNHYRDVAVRTKDWKLIYRESRDIQEQYSWWRRLSGDTSKIPEFELYSVTGKNPEQQDMSVENPAVFADLKRRVMEWVEQGKEQRKLISPDLD